MRSDEAMNVLAILPTGPSFLLDRDLSAATPTRWVRRQGKGRSVDAIVFFCQSCGARFEVDPRFAGKRGHCKKCGQVMTIPRAEQLSSMMAMPALVAAGGGAGLLASGQRRRRGRWCFNRFVAQRRAERRGPRAAHARPVTAAPHSAIST